MGRTTNLPTTPAQMRAYRVLVDDPDAPQTEQARRARVSLDTIKRVSKMLASEAGLVPEDRVDNRSALSPLTGHQGKQALRERVEGLLSDGMALMSRELQYWLHEAPPDARPSLPAVVQAVSMLADRHQALQDEATRLDAILREGGQAAGPAMAAAIRSLLQRPEVAKALGLQVEQAVVVEEVPVGPDGDADAPGPPLPVG